MRKTKKLGQNENIEKKGKGDHIIYLRVSFTVQSNIPPTFEKKLRKNFKTKNKGVNTGSELRAPFKVIFSIFRKKGGKNEKVQKNDKVDKEKEK